MKCNHQFILVDLNITTGAVKHAVCLSCGEIRSIGRNGHIDIVKEGREIPIISELKIHAAKDNQG